MFLHCNISVTNHGIEFLFYTHRLDQNNIFAILFYYEVESNGQFTGFLVFCKCWSIEKELMDKLTGLFENSQ